jgi:hypothetical protein
MDTLLEIMSHRVELSFAGQGYPTGDVSAYKGGVFIAKPVFPGSGGWARTDEVPIIFKAAKCRSLCGKGNKRRRKNQRNTEDDMQERASSYSVYESHLALPGRFVFPA